MEQSDMERNWAFSRNTFWTDLGFLNKPQNILRISLWFCSDLKLPNSVCIKIFQFLFLPGFEPMTFNSDTPCST